jgi:hypothetical protein
VCKGWKFRCEGKFCAKSATSAPLAQTRAQAGIEKLKWPSPKRAKAEAELIFQPRKGRILIRERRRSWLSAARRKMRRFIANMNDLWVFSLENCACTLNSDLQKKGGGAEQIILSQVALVPLRPGESSQSAIPLSITAKKHNLVATVPNAFIIYDS